MTIKAEDTVLKTERIIDYLRQLDIPTPTQEGYTFLKMLEALESQAEETWRVAIQEGRKEVIEEIKEASGLIIAFINKERNKGKDDDVLITARDMLNDFVVSLNSPNGG